MRVAVMQPYFVPFAGYFRLFACADLFVVYDCVQFKKGHWVHRNRLRDRAGNLRWLTLPIRRAPLGTRIKDMRFSDDSRLTMARRMRAFPALMTPPPPGLADLYDQVAAAEGDFVDYIVACLRLCCEKLSLGCPVMRSSELALDPALRRGERVRTVMRSVGAEHFINPPGGRRVHDPAEYERAGHRLTFLKAYEGPADSILQRLLTEPAESIRAEILRECYPDTGEPVSLVRHGSAA